MASVARNAFDENVKDVKKLLELHVKEGGRDKGRRYNLEVLNKSAIVLITAFWEAYCEDIAGEALAHIVQHAPDASVLPKPLQKQVLNQLQKEKHELALWKLADRGWRTVIKDRFDDLKVQRERKLNTPKWENIDLLFKEAIGLENVSKAWSWARKMNANNARTKLDKYVTLRGAIAHRGNDGKSVTKSQVEDYFDFVQKLVGKTGGRVKTHVKNITGKELW